MTLLMADSISVANLPATFDAYLGYCDGEFNTEADLKIAFPDKPLVILSVFGSTDITGCDGVDIEKGDYTASSGVAAIGPIMSSKPVIYASVEGNPGEGMPDVLNALRAAGIDRSRVRLLSGHYTYQKHICGPRPSCGAINIPMDGTQYTNQAIGNNGTDIDASLLNDDFFDGTDMNYVIPGLPAGTIFSTEPVSFIDTTTGNSYWIANGTDGTLFMAKCVAGTWTVSRI